MSALIEFNYVVSFAWNMVIGSATEILVAEYEFDSVVFDLAIFHSPKLISGTVDQRLRGYNADTGAVIYAGGGPNELMSGTRQWNTGIVAHGRIHFTADNKVYAFKLRTSDAHRDAPTSSHSGAASHPMMMLRPE